MLNRIISFSIRNKLIIGLFILALIAWGGYEVTRLPIDAVPDITNTQVQIITTAPSLGAPDVERLITFPIEQANSNIPGLKEIRSLSRFGLSLVTIVFDDDADVYWTRQQVSERLQSVDIPDNAGTPQLAPVTTGLGEIYQYVVRPEKGYENRYSLADLRTIQDWIIRRQLLGTRGVADVSSFGGELKQYEVAVNPEKLKSFRLTISDVFNALQTNNSNTGGAYIEKGPTVLFIRSEGLVQNIADIQNIVVQSTADQMPVLVRDIGEVREGAAVRYGALTYNAEGEVAGAIVMMLKGENSSEVIKRVKEKIAAIQKTLPEGIRIEPFLDRTKMVNNAIGTVERNLVEGALIVVFVLVLFLGNLRAGFIVASMIPLSMLFAIIMMNLFGVSGNLMSLGALDFGLIVDGAVIIVEAVLHHLSASKQYAGLNRISQGDMDAEVGSSASRMMNAAVFGQIIILIVYLPILSLQGIEGKMFKPMAQTVAFAILGAFLLSLTYVPLMSALFISKKISHQPNLSDRIMAKLEQVYARSLKGVLRMRKTVLATGVALFILALFLFSRMGGEFIPQLEEGDFAVETRLLTGSNLHTTIKATQQISKILLDSFPEVQKVVTRVGTAEIPTDPMPLEGGDVVIILKDKKEWVSARSFPEIADKMAAKVQAVPGVTTGFQYPVQMRFNEMMTGAKQDVICKIFGDNLDTLAAYAARLKSISATIPGAADLYAETVIGMPQIVVSYNRGEIAKWGLNIDDVNRTINAAFAGATAGQVYEGEKRFDLVVRVGSEGRTGVGDVQNLLVSTPSGQQIPLEQVATIREIEGPNQIQRENAQRRIIVGFNVRGRDVQSVVQEMQKKVEAGIRFPPGYYVTYGGAFENLQQAKERLSIAVPVSLILIFVMLYFAFRSVKEGVLIYSAIPLSAIGGVFALWLRGMPFSISAGVGFIALFGVAVLNGIVLISEFNRLKNKGPVSILELVVAGGRNRLRPVLMTASVASLGFLPMALSNGAGAEVQRPLATVVIGGLISATLLTLYVLPVLYVMFEKTKGRSLKKTKRVATVTTLVLFAPIAMQAQQITLPAAIDTALKNSGSIRAYQTSEQYYAVLQGAFLDIPSTSINAEYGKFNSNANDNRFLVTQAISFPAVYRAQRSISHLGYDISRTTTRLNAIQLKAAVKSVYYELLVLQQRQILLEQADSIYSAFLQKTELRFKAGDADLVEKATAESQRTQISVQLSDVKTAYANALTRFYFLLNGSGRYEPVPAEPSYNLTTVPDTSLLEQTPAIQLQQQQLGLSREQQKLERSKLLPLVSIGYSNSSIIGYQRIGTDEKYFDGSKRFSSVSGGLALPIFRTAQRARIKAAGLLIRQRSFELLAARRQASAELVNAIRSYTRYRENGATYRSVLLPNAMATINAITQRLNSGAISYLEWVVLLNQAFQVRASYLDLIQQTNEAAIQVEKFSATN
ncbi:MAG: CusA/CzcA family heavy metal efflux RND transporter [Williamsia sp.]|nr:CusA/CzcA family heavy metal efflux RND transporter [Williamsia sp.]